MAHLPAANARSLAARRGTTTLTPMTLDSLETRVFLNAAPVAPGFPDCVAGHAGEPFAPRFAEHVTYDGQVPSLHITYAEMLALSQASDAEGDTIYFLSTGSEISYEYSYGDVDTSKRFGIVGPDGQVLDPLVMGSNNLDLSRFDTNNDGVPDGPYVLEPGETWVWRGLPNMPFTGRDLPPDWGGRADTSVSVVVTDRIRPLTQTVSGYFTISGNQSVAFDSHTDVWDLANVDLGHKGSTTFTFEQLLTLIGSYGTASDPEGAPVSLVIRPGDSGNNGYWSSLYFGTLMVGGTSINALAGDYSTNYFFDDILTADSPLVLTAGESVTFTSVAPHDGAPFDGIAFRASLWDGLSSTRGRFNVRAKALDNQLPHIDAAVDLGLLASSRAATFSYDELLALAHVSDPDGDTLELRVSQALELGHLKVNGQSFTTSPVIHPGDTVEFSSAGFGAGITGFKLSVSDGWNTSVGTYTFSSADFATGGPIGDTAIITGGAVASVSNGYPFGSHVAAWRNASGQLIVSIENLHDSSPTVTRVQRNLTTEYGLPALTGDPIALGRMTEFAVPTTQGLMLVGFTATTSDAAGWSAASPFYIHNLSLGNADVPTTQLAVVTSPAGDLGTVQWGLLWGLAGRNNAGDVVIMYQTDAMFTPRDVTKVFNVTQAVEARGLTMPQLAGGFVAYAQRWGGYNIVGLDGAGDLIGVWTGGFYRPGNDGYNNIETSVWSVDNLSRITGAARLVGAISVFSTDWNAINIIGTSETGHAIATWWAPQLGDGNWLYVDFTSDFGGVPLAANSLTGWVTPWGALNIAGVDQSGQVQVYWWFPTNITSTNPAGWRFESLASPQFSTNTRLTSDSFAGYWSTGVAGEQITRMTIYGADDAGRVGFTYWEPTLGTQWASDWA